MAHKYNGGLDATICDRCCIMLTEGRRTLRPFFSIRAEARDDYEQVFDFCRVKCLDDEIERMAERIEHRGEEYDDTRINLARLRMARGHFVGNSDVGR